MRLTVHFSGIKNEIVKALKSASSEIKVAVAWLSDEDIIRTLAQKAQHGLDVQIVISNAKENFHSSHKLETLLISGAKIHVAAPKFLHNKFCVIDQELVINGSYNWTYSARNNEENIIIITLNTAIPEDKKIVSSFLYKHTFFCDKASTQVNNFSELSRFSDLQIDVPLQLAKLDEEEILLRQELENDVRKSFDESKTLGIGVSEYLLERMRLDGGGVEFIKRILYDEISSGEMKSGFRKLEEPIPHRVDLSLEYLVSRPKYAALFTIDEINFCKKVMTKYRL